MMKKCSEFKWQAAFDKLEIVRDSETGFDSLTEIGTTERCDNLELNLTEGHDFEGYKPHSDSYDRKRENRVVSISSEDWVLVPQGDMVDFETDTNESPGSCFKLQKQRSQSSSLDKTLSYIFASKSCGYKDRKLEKILFPRGCGKVELNQPHGLVYDRETERLFIADSGNNRIQVYQHGNTPNTKKLKERTRTLSNIFMSDPRMDKPWGICTSEDYVFVTQYNGHCVDVYTRNRNFVTRFGGKGFGIGSFSCPTGICSNGSDVLICDSNNNRIQIFSKQGKEFKYSKNFGIRTLMNPLDIKIFNTQIFILDSSKKCMHQFDISYKYTRSLISNGPKREVDNPKFFDIDEEGNFVISDWLNHAVKVFNSEGHIVAVISVSDTLMCPKGIAVGECGDVFLLDETEEGQLKIF